MKIKSVLYSILLWSFLFTSCEEVIQEELDDQRVQIVSPTDELVTTILAHHFLWEKVDHAEGYVFQLAAPSFQEIQQLIVNEERTELSYDYTLSPGKYEWRVKAFNNISETPFTTFSITIDSTLDLGSAQVVLKDPADGFITNNPLLNWSWNKIAIADDYLLEVRTPDWANGTNAINPVTTENSTYSNSDALAEGTYAWSVAAKNDFSISPFSAPRTFTIDLTSPASPTPTSPANNATLASKKFSYQWTRTDDNGSEIGDSLYVYSDVNKQFPVRELWIKDTKTHPDSLESGTFYWQLKSVDAAGNKSDLSTLWSFTVQ